MPLPLLFIGLGAATAAAGVGKTVKAGMDNSKAKSINENANRRIESRSNKLDGARKQCGSALEHLGKEKISILNTSVKKFLDSFEKLKNVDFADSQGLNELNNLHIDSNVFAELKEMESFASSLAGGAVAGVAGGAFAAFGAYSAATTFATASTGTAIASLSGIAAKSATLAFFGGGSLAAQGLGVAGGTAVLGGLVAGPALLVMGLVTGAKASKNLDHAYANDAKADEICEQLQAATDQCKAIRRRTYMLYTLLARLDTYFLPLIYQLEEVIDKEGTDYSTFTSDARKTVVASVSVAATVKAVLDTAILTEEGSLTEESEMTVQDVVKILKEKEKEK